MTNEELFDYFMGHLTARLKNQVTAEFRTECLEKLKNKRISLYLQGEALAVNMAQFCNMAGKLMLPLYFDDNVPEVIYERGFNYVCDEELEYMDAIIRAGRFAVYKIEKEKASNGTDRYKFHFYVVLDKKQQHVCEMLSDNGKESINANNIQDKFVDCGWVRNGKDTNTVGHIHKDNDIESTSALCPKHYCLKAVICLYYYSKYILHNYL